MAVELQLRPDGSAILFAEAAAASSRAANPWEPEVGNTVTLQSDDTLIQARITEARARQYEGEVVGLAGAGSQSFQRFASGTTLSFGHQHLFECRR
jgi:hypothetical protein